jgi:hypothetical protein
MLVSEIDEERLAKLLDTNDLLTSAIEKWQSLVSLGVADMADNPVNSETLAELKKVTIQPSTANTSDFLDHQVRALTPCHERPGFWATT